MAVVTNSREPVQHSCERRNPCHRDVTTASDETCEGIENRSETPSTAEGNYSLRACIRSLGRLIRSKRFQRTAAIFTVSALLFCAIACAQLYSVAANANHDFSNELFIPESDEGKIIDGVRQFHLIAAKSEKQFLPGQITRTAGINGPYLGPTLQMKRGDKVELTVENQLGEVTTMHWHGMHVPAKMDGTPHQEIESGESWTASFPVDQPAATLWYHPHPHRNTGPQVYSGLAGQLWIEDGNTKALNLPTTYGVDDIPVIIQDRNFTRSNQFRVPGGVGLGTTILVNGTLDPMVKVERQQVRFRLLNGSNGRIYHIGFADEREFLQIGTDGGLLEKPVATKRVILAPGERAEIVADFSDGEEAMLKSFPEAGLLETAEMILWGQGSGNFNLLRIQPSEEVSSTEHAKIDTGTALCSIRRYDAENASVTRHIRLGGRVPRNGTDDSIQAPENDRQRGNARGNGGPRGRGFAINGQSMDMHRIDERVRLGDTEIWELTNGTGAAHPFHIHLVQFQVLTRNGKAPKGTDLGWKDTILVHPGDRIRIIMKFDRYSDPQTPYMYHCHIMAHEDNGMMGQFLVVEEPRQLALLKGEPTVIVFVYGLECEHCFDQVQLFDEKLEQEGINLVVITPEESPNKERRKAVNCPIISDPDNNWAGWFKMMHEGPVHGTLLVGIDGKVRWSSTEETPYMNIAP